MKHKYGFHVNRTGDDVFAAIQRVKPRVVKALDHNIGFWSLVRAVHPDVFLIGRLFVPQHEQERFGDDPAGHGQRLAGRILRLEANKVFFEGRPLFDAWESYNEVMPESASPDKKRRYDDFQVAFAKPLIAAGLKPIAMNFATGNMLGFDFLNYFPGTLKTYELLGFHEYDWPTMWRLHQENIRDKGEEGMWLTLRYRRTMREVRRVHGDRHKVIITECGMTQGVQGGPDVGPWHPSHPIGEESYWESLMWYNDELMKDDYVAAALLFVVGAVEPWHSFEHLGGIVNRLAAFQAGVPGLPEKPAKPGQPVEQPAGPLPEEPNQPGQEEPAQPQPEEPEEPQPEEPEEPQPEEPTEPQPDVPPEPRPVLTLPESLLQAAARAQVIQFNPQAALQKVIFADGLVPNSPEFEVEHLGDRYIAQRAEHLGSGEVRVYYVRFGDWANVTYIIRGEDYGLQMA